jgi:hypothetical protein
VSGGCKKIRRGIRVLNIVIVGALDDFWFLDAQFYWSDVQASEILKLARYQGRRQAADNSDASNRYAHGWLLGVLIPLQTATWHWSITLDVPCYGVLSAE